MTAYGSSVKPLGGTTQSNFSASDMAIKNRVKAIDVSSIKLNEIKKIERLVYKQEISSMLK